MESRQHLYGKGRDHETRDSIHLGIQVCRLCVDVAVSHTINWSIGFYLSFVPRWPVSVLLAMPRRTFRYKRIRPRKNCGVVLKCKLNMMEPDNKPEKVM